MSEVGADAAAATGGFECVLLRIARVRFVFIDVVLSIRTYHDYRCIKLRIIRLGLHIMVTV